MPAMAVPNDECNKYGLDLAQLRKAFVALIKYLHGQQQGNELIEEDDLFYLVVALKSVPFSTKNDKPYPLPLPHPLHSTDNADICLFVKDHKGEGHKEAKQKVQQDSTIGVKKVIGLSKLRTKYESYESKRELCKAYDLFLADNRILPSLPKAIGKSFFSRKKQPIPVDLTSGDWGQQVKKATQATYLLLTGGSCVNIRVARSSMSVEQCVDNVLAALAAAVPRIPHKWDNIRALHIKTADSAALPIYQALPESLPGQRRPGAPFQYEHTDGQTDSHKDGKTYAQLAIAASNPQEHEVNDAVNGAERADLAGDDGQQQDGVAGFSYKVDKAEKRKRLKAALQAVGKAGSKKEGKKQKVDGKAVKSSARARAMV